MFGDYQMNTLSRRGFLSASAAALSLAAVPSLLLPVRQARADGHKVITAGKRVIEVNGKPAKASYDVKVGAHISIAFGARTVTVEVLAVAEAVRKDDAAAMYREI